MIGPFRRRRIVARIARGELREDDPAVRAELARDPALAARLLAHKSRAAGPPTHGAPPGADRARRPRWAPWVSLVLLLAATAMFARDLVSPPPTEPRLGEGQRRVAFADEGATRLLVRLPEPRVEEFGTIAFDGVRPPDGRFRVEIRHADAPEGSAPILVRDPLLENAWTPTGEERLRLPDAIAITVRAFDATGAEVASTTQRSRRVR